MSISEKPGKLLVEPMDEGALEEEAGQDTVVPPKWKQEDIEETRARRWYLRIFGYSLDLFLVNSWLLYRRDCLSLNQVAMSLKHFILDISSRCRKQHACSFF